MQSDSGARRKLAAPVSSGVRNAAWDITVLSDFVRKIPEGERSRERYILATQDRALAAVAPLVLLGPSETEDQISLAQALATWWPHAEAATIANTLFELVARVERGGRPQRPSDYVDTCIDLGEAKLRGWVEP